MSKLETHLLAEDPSIVLIGNNTILTNQIVKNLQQHSLRVITINTNSLFKKEFDFSVFKDVYKIVWIYERNSDQNYLNILGFFKNVFQSNKLNVPIIIISNLIINLNSFSTNYFSEWRKKSQAQTQFIVDCNYYLPKASFIFGQDVLTSGVKNTTLEFLTQNINKKVILNPNITLGFVELNDFVSSIKEYLFRPRDKRSILIKALPMDDKNNSITRLIKKLYDAYHNISLEVINDQVTFKNTVPFSVEEKILTCDPSKQATEIVKILPPPSREEVKNINLEKPTKNLFLQKKEFKNNVSMDYVVENSQVKNKSINLNTKNKLGKKIIKKENELDVGKEIQRIFKTTRANTKVNRIRQIAKSSKKNTKKSKRRRILFIGGLGVAGISTGIITLIIVFITSQFLLKKELTKTITAGFVDQNITIIKKNNLKNITKFVDIQASRYSSVVENNLITKAISMVEMSNNIQSMPQTLLEAIEASKNLFLQITIGDTGKTSELAQILENKAQLAYEKLLNIQLGLDQISLGLNSQEKQESIKKYDEKIKQLKESVSIQRQLLPILPSLFGEKTKRTYAVVLQNNQELRPTGGFIQAIALLNFDNGSLASYKVYSVYELDRRLPGEIIPPDDIKKYLGEEKWYLRDSNWNPDFPATSKRITWFINKSLGVDVDGVVALNLFTLKDILKVTGPLDLPEYNEVITYKNIFERMEFHSEVVLVDSPKTTDYSVIVFKKILAKVIRVEREKIPDLLAALKKSFNENQLLISVLEKQDQTALFSLGWTGDLVKPPCPTRLNLVDCGVNVIAQVEANVGINKANYYLSRKVDHLVEINRKKATHNRKIIYKNNARSNSWPKGTYKSFQRFYIDKNALLDKILINGTPLSDDLVSVKKLDDFQEIGIRLDVPIQKQVVVELKYTVPQSFKKGFSYVFFNKKQPGIKDDSLGVSFKYSNDLKPVLIAPSAEVFNNIITFDTNNNSLFGVEFE